MQLFIASQKKDKEVKILSSTGPASVFEFSRAFETHQVI